MRQASYIVHGENGASADISLVTLGATSGNVLDNVNRWLGQLGQPPITDGQLPEVVQHLPGDLGHVAVVDLQGKPEQARPGEGWPHRCRHGRGGRRNVLFQNARQH